MKTRINKCVDSFREAVIVPTLGANGGYWKVKSDEGDRERTNLTFYYELYRFIRT